MFFPVEVTLRKKLSFVTFHTEPILGIMKGGLENSDADIIEPTERGFYFRNNIFSLKRSKYHALSGVRFGRLALENYGTAMALKYTYNIWLIFAVMLVFAVIAFASLQNKAFIGPPLAIVIFFGLNWLYIYYRQRQFLNNIAGNIERAYARTPFKFS